MAGVDRFFLYPKDVDKFGFDWGQLSLTVGPEVNGAKTFSGVSLIFRAGRVMPGTTILDRKRSSS